MAASGDAPWQGIQSSISPVEKIPVSALLPSDSPRLAGEQLEHAQTLARSEATLPPIIVHRDTYRVIDGMHRLTAAVLRGEREIEVRFFEGSGHDAFVVAVEANIRHGLPLSTADRTAAAGRILTTHPQWSDRSIAAVTGLASKTVSALRRRTTDGVPLQARVGLDGRVRPLSTAEGRRLAEEFLATNPQASLREVAAAAGISPGTVRDVRDRLRRGEAPTLPPRRAGRPGADRDELPPRAGDEGPMLHVLRRDPSLRLSEAGRQLLRLLDGYTALTRECELLVGSVPPYSADMVAEAARACAEAWRLFARQVEQRRASATDDATASG